MNDWQQKMVVQRENRRQARAASRTQPSDTSLGFEVVTAIALGAVAALTGVVSLGEITR